MAYHSSEQVYEPKLGRSVNWQHDLGRESITFWVRHQKILHIHISINPDESILYSVPSFQLLKFHMD